MENNNVIQSNPISVNRHTLMRITGFNGLAIALNSLKSNDIAIFDYDRTITTATFNPKSEIDRVRGGQNTINAMTLAKNRGVHLFVVSARSFGMLPSIIADIRNMPTTIAPLFDINPIALEPNDVEKRKIELQSDGEKYGYFSNVYCGGYEKPRAIEHILYKRIPHIDTERNILFLDDFYQNSYDVFASIKRFIIIDPNIILIALWWDPIDEEIEGTIKMLSLTSSENSYNDIYRSNIECLFYHIFKGTSIWNENRKKLETIFKLSEKD
jgi:hypothetical protein